MAPSTTDVPSTPSLPKGAPDCASAKCGHDAGCRLEPDGGYVCICSHDLSVKVANRPCPRIVVTGPYQPTNRNNLLVVRRTTVGRTPTTTNTNSVVIDHQLGAGAGQTIHQRPSLISDSSATATGLQHSSVAVWLLPTVALLAAVLLAVVWLKLRKGKTTSHQSGHKPRSSSNLPVGRRRSHSPADSSSTTTKSGHHHMPVALRKNLLDQSRFMANPEYDWNGQEGSLGGDDEEDDIDDKFKSFSLIRPEWIVLQQEIGEGCFGKVFRGSLLKMQDKAIAGGQEQHHLQIDQDHEEPVAVKVLKAAAGPTAQEDLLHEAEIMASFTHPNILALRGIVINESTIGPWLVFEYMALGDLAQLLRASNANHPCGKSGKLTYTLSQEDLHLIAEQIADGMAYLSSQHFVHRDLACRNCLVGQRPATADGQAHQLAVKISDFGMSRDVYTCDYYKIGGSRMLPVRWMSPESILYGKFTLESDVWSYGVVLWEVFTLGVQPYYGHSNEQVVKLILQGILLTPPNRAPPLICQLLNSCWKTQPNDRINFAQIHSKLKMDRNQRLNYPLPPTAVPPPPASPSSTITYVQLESEGRVTPEYLQPLPDLPIYSNT